MSYQEYLYSALSLSKECAVIFKEGFTNINEISWKEESDPVTEYDKKIELYVRKRLNTLYPTHDILGEEDGLEGGSSDYQWIVDPIDGTINYIRGIAFVAFSLALSYKGTIIVSVVANPILDEYFWASKGGGAFLNSKPIHVSGIQNLHHAYVVFGRYREQYSSQFHQLIKDFQSVRNPGSAALALAYIAVGRIEGAIYSKLSPWDVAGGWLLIEEAGGIITNLNGSPFSFEDPSLLAGNQQTHNHIKKMFNS